MKRATVFLFFVWFNTDLFSQEQSHQPFFNKGEQYFERQNYTEAITAYEKALKYAEINVGKQHVDYANILYGLGISLYYNGQKSEGITYVDEGIDILEKNGLTKNNIYIEATFSRADIYYSEGNYDKAEICFIKMLEVKKSMNEGEDKEFAQIQGSLGLIQQGLGKYKESELNLLQSLRLLEDLKLERTIDYPSALNNLANLYHNQQQYFIAKPYYERALKSFKTIETELGENYVSCLQNLGELYLDIVNFERAEQFFLRAKFLKEKIYGLESPQYATILNDLAVLYNAMGQYSKSEQLYLQALNIKKKYLDEDNISYIKGLYNMGMFYRNLGRENESISNIIKAVKLLEPFKDEQPVQYAEYLSGLAGICIDFQKYEEAEKYLKEALELYKKMFGESGENYLFILQNLGRLYEEKGEFARAEAEYMKVYTIVQKSENPDVFFNHQISASIGVFYQKQRKSNEAERYSIAAADLSRKYYGINSKEYLRDLTNLAIVYSDQKKNKEAEAMYTEALDKYIDIIEKDFAFMTESEKAEYYATIEPTISSFYTFAFNLGTDISSPIVAKVYDYRLATKGLLFQNANKIKKSILSSNDSSLLDTYSKWKSQKNYLAKVSALSTEELRSKGVDLDSLQKSTDLMEKELSLRSDVFTRSKISKKTTWKDVQNKLKSGEAAVEIIRVEQHFEKTNETGARYFALVVAKDDKYPVAISIDSYGTFENGYVKSVRTQIGQMLNDETTSKGMAEFVVNEKVYNKFWKQMGWIEIKPGDWILPPDPVLSYEGSVANNISKGFEVTDQDMKKLVEVLAKEVVSEIDQNIVSNEIPAKYSAELDKLRNDSKKIVRIISDQIESYKTYRSSWGRIEHALGVDGDKNKTKKIFLSTDGAFNQISISCMKDMYWNNYVVDKGYEICLVSNTKDILNYKAGSGNINNTNITAELFGFPDYNYDVTKLVASEETKNSTRGIRDSKFYLPELPGTKVETENINRIFKSRGIKTSLYLDKNAVEQKIKTLKRPTILHIATHGFFEEDEKASTQTRSSDFTQKVSNPLLRSGLMMAGASNEYSLDYKDEVAFSEFEDGVFTAYEAMNLDLEGTELVVLSACQTGLGEIKNGEGVYGLQRAFQLAGAKSIIMSLWSVNDEATQLLMTTFYQKWFESGDKHKAFKEAQLELKKTFPHPYYWAAFVLVGE